MPKPRRPMEPLLDRLLVGKVPKEVAAELGITHATVNQLFARYLRESGCKTLIQAVAKYAREKSRDGTA